MTAMLLQHYDFICIVVLCVLAIATTNSMTNMMPSDDRTLKYFTPPNGQKSDEKK